MNVTRRPWGEIEGRPVWLFDIEGDGMRATVSNYGGVMQALEVRDAAGNPLDVVLGYDTLAEYRECATFFGAMIGPIADRLDRGRCVLDGRTVQLPLNAGPDAMHCADCGFHAMVWDWEILPDGVRFFRTLDESEIRFPGQMAVSLSYRLRAPDALRLEYAATGTRETAASFTNHSYFNLNGGAVSCRDQVLTVRASRYAETERMVEPICTGRALPVDGTPFDLRAGVRVGEAAGRSDFPEVAAAGGVDHFFLADGEGFREVASIDCAETGLRLRCLTDAPGLLVYTGNGLVDEHGKGGRVYGRNWAVCLETERFPNAVNFPDRRGDVLLEPGERYETTTEFVFERTR